MERLAAFSCAGWLHCLANGPSSATNGGWYCTRRDSQAVKIALSNRQEREIKRDGKEGEREYILENQFHWEDRSMVAQLWNIAFCFSNDLFPHWLYLFQRKGIRHHSGVQMIAYGFLPREKSENFASCWHNGEEKWKWQVGNSWERSVELLLCVYCAPKVTVLTLLLATSSSYRQVCLFHMYTTFIYWSQRGTLMWAADLLSYLMTAPVEQTIVSVQNSWINKSLAALL